MTTGWLVPITTLRREPGARRSLQRSGHVGALRVGDSTVAADAEVDIDVVLTGIDGGIEVAGVVSAPWQGECRRCLRPVAGMLTPEVRELYRPEGADHPDDEDTYPLGADHLDLAPLVRDALLLALPVAPLCSPDCVGLCPICGADRAVDACDCEPVAAGSPWAALDVLRDGGGAPGDASA